MKTSEIFDKAADELTIRGKLIGRLIEDKCVVVDELLTTTLVPGGKVCALGALYLANGYSEEQLFEAEDYDEDLPGAIEFGRFLLNTEWFQERDLVNSEFDAVMRFNDSNEDEDMADLFRLAAKELREKGS